MKRTNQKPAILAWITVAVFVNFLILDEILGIAHVWGLRPITEDAIVQWNQGHPLLLLSVAAAGPVFLAWWIIHIYRRLFGDLKGEFSFRFSRVKKNDISTTA